MRMRIAGAHHGAAIFKNLYVIDPGYAPQLAILFGPHVQHSSNLSRAHLGESKILLPGEAGHAADSFFAARNHQPVVIELAPRTFGVQSREVIFKDESSRFIGVT